MTQDHWALHADIRRFVYESALGNGHEPSRLLRQARDMLSTLGQMIDHATEFTVGDVKVCYRDEGRWAVMSGGLVLRDDGEWVHEPIPSNRTDEFKEHTRFALPDALERAGLSRPTLEED